MIRIDKEQEKKLWDKYKKYPSQKNQHKLFDLYYQLGISISNRYLKSHGCYSAKDEIEQYALLGLLDAIKKYEPKKSNFRTYANTRAYYHIIDMIRVNGKYNTRGKKTIVPVSLDHIRDNNDEGEWDITKAGESYHEFMFERQELIDFIYSSKLEEREKKICKLFFVDNYTYDEIASGMELCQSRISQLMKYVILPLIKECYLDHNRGIVKDFMGE